MMLYLIAALAVFTALATGIPTTTKTVSLLGDEVTPPPASRCELMFQTCLSPMFADSDSTQSGSPELWSPLVLRKQCSLLTTVERCMESQNLETCPAEAIAGWRAMSEVMRYLCNDVFSELMNVSGCVHSQKTQSDLHRCVGMITRGQQSMASGPMSDSEKCRLMEQYEECVIDVDGTDCGSKVQNLYMRIFSKINTIMEINLDCASVGAPEDTLTGDEAAPEPVGGRLPIPEADSQCEMVIGECLRPLEPHRKGFTSFQLETIPQLCSDFVRVQQCLDKSADLDCEDTPEWTILENSLEQICEAGDKYALSACKTGNIVTEVRSCERDELKEEVELEDSRVCRVIDEYVNCYTVMYSRKCGEVHGKMVSEVMTGVAQVIQLEKDVVCVDSGDKPDMSEEGLGDVLDRTSRRTTHWPTTHAAPFMDDNPVFDKWGPLKKCMGNSAALLMSPLPTHTHKSFSDLCDDSLRAVQCEKIFDDEISDDVRVLWQDFMTAVNYMCVEKRSEFARVYSCLSGLGNPMQKCYANQVNEELDEETICKMIDNVEDCTVDTVKDNCGHEAGHLMRGFMKKMNKVLSKQTGINCSWETKRHLLIGLSAGGALLLVLLVTCMCCAIRRRSRRSVNLEKKDLVKNDVLQANLKLTMENEQTKDIAVLSVNKLKD